MKKTYDIIVFGATSFVGKIISRHLLTKYGINKEVNWAIAGRSAEKLNDLKVSLNALNIPTIIADAGDADSLTLLCSQTKVVISTVGPFALYGEPMVKACAETGTDYCDLTGEAPWIAEMISKYEVQAKQSGARIVHCCGFDSIPSDMGVYFTQQQALKKFGQYCQTVQMRVKVIKGGASGGTVASLIDIGKQSKTLKKLLEHPYSLCPSDHEFSQEQRGMIAPTYDENHSSWTSHFFMASINTCIVHRSNALLSPEKNYGDDFQYDEAMLLGGGIFGRIMAYAYTAGFIGFFNGSGFGPTRYIINKLAPKPGNGPSEKSQEAGWYDFRFVGTTAAGDKIRCKVTGDKDPGYGSTAKIIPEAALCLAFDLDKENDSEGGFFTTASLMGDKLITRLVDNAGLEFEVIT